MHTPQEEEDIVLNAATKCIESKSILTFTMADIAKEAGFSMGTVYKQVKSKEDVLVALANKSMIHTKKIFFDFFQSDLTTPEKLIGCMLFTPDKLHLYPFGVHLEMMVFNNAVLEKASTRWLQAMSRTDEDMEIMFSDLLKHACENGELNIREADLEVLSEEINVILWSMYTGFVHVTYQRKSRSFEKAFVFPFPLQPNHPLVGASKRLINSYPWKEPLDENSIHQVCTLMDSKGYR